MTPNAECDGRSTTPARPDLPDRDPGRFSGPSNGVGVGEELRVRAHRLVRRQPDAHGLVAVGIAALAEVPVENSRGEFVGRVVAGDSG